jgi:hypothetical protein
MNEEVLPAAEDEHSQELAVGPAPGTLFRTDDPVEIIARATEVAKALSEVLKAQGLTSRIKDKDYVRVEGWTLCGTMLGVFPVVEWTRQVENGWEARVEARTRDGATVGAAEAECLRSESRWKTADDYAVRSMAQTRAISKALRAPLGFIVSLAGFEATPAEEMTFLEENKPFDPSTDLLPGAISGKDAPKTIAGALNELEPTVNWQELIQEVVSHQYADSDGEWRNLKAKDQKDFWRRLSNATFKMQERSPFGAMPPISLDAIAECIAYAFDGYALEEVPYIEVDFPDVEDIPFGE